MLKELSSMAAPTATRLSAEVDEIPGVLVAVPQDGGFGIVEHGEDLIVARFALSGQLELETPEAASEKRPPVVRILARR